MKHWILWISSTLIVLNITAQEYKHIIIPPQARVEVQSIQQDYAPVLQTLETVSPTGGVRKHHVEQLSEQRSQDAVQLGTAPQPQILASFAGNQFNFRTPNDNDLAISNSGMLVSVINSIIFFYDANTERVVKSASLAVFADSLGFPEFKYDPKVVYDPAEDRFVMVYLNGNLDTTSRIILAFSATNDPLGEWYLYGLPGNPLTNNTWSDYPNIGLSTDELFLTFNTFTNGSVNNNGFVESTIWQINKYDGYANDTLRSRYLAGLTYQGEPFFNITPIQGGNGLYGPGMYFLSNRNLHTENDTLFLFYMDNTIANGGQLSIQALTANQRYGLPPGAMQPVADTFDTNDTRILGGFLHRDTIQFVGNTHVFATGKAGVYHGVITHVSSPSPAVSLQIIGDTLLDLAYPNIAYCGTSPTDHSAIITMNKSASTVFSGFTGLYADGIGGYSDLISLREGITGVDILLSSVERWGDYSGIQPKYDEPGVVWAVGSYGRSNVHYSWIASLQRPTPIGQASIAPPVPVELFPNPSSDRVTVSFRLDNPARITFRLLGQSGQLADVLVEDVVRAGTQQFSCRIGHLPAGAYWLEAVTADGQRLFVEQIVKQ